MVTMVVCSILKPEITQVVKQLKIPLHIVWMPPELHNYPVRLKEELEHHLKTIKDEKVVVYGKCFPEIDEVCNQYGAERIRGENCYEIVAGERFFHILKEEPGTYFLLPQLCEKFEELTGEIHLKGMKDIFFKNYNQCVLLDTGITCKKCRKIAENLGLPFYREYVGVSTLEKRVKKLLNKKQRPK